jgi:hypothetical protein
MLKIGGIIVMKKKIMKINAVLSLVIIGIMLTVTFMPIITGADINRVDGFDKGPSYLPVVPMKKVTMVNFDEDTYLDDYAYLASVPSSVFNYNDKLYSSPLLFYQEELEIKEEKEVTLDARKGLNYFMEDWMSYCTGQMDQMILINLDENDLDDDWNAKEYVTISGETASDIANQIALADWSYSDDAVIAVIEDDFQETEIETIGEVSGTLHSKDVKKLETFNLKQTNSLNPVFYDFDVDEGYKYMEADCWWDGYIVNILIGEAMIPTGDPDIQLYCKYNDGWMQTSAAAAWNIYSPIGHEPSQAYVYKSGSWRVGVTDMPTEGETGIEPPRKPLLFGKFITQQGTFNGWIKDKIDGSVTYHVDITLYPGVEVEVPDLPPFGCRDAEIKLRWDDDNVNLGFTLVGPSGEAIITVAGEPEESGLQEIDLYSLGECLDGESYTISVFSKDDLSRPLDFTVEYSWKQKISQKQGDALASATEGSVLASTLNAPLLYVNSTTIDDDTISALYMLGVENIYLVDFGGHISEQTFSDLEYNFVIKKHYELIDDIIFDICEMTGSNDIVFTTIDPWTYWYMKELKPGGETDAGMFIGPAAYIAAHHGTPVLIVDMHPQLSSAVTYHNELWRHFSKERYDGLPSSGEMVLTGQRIYDFLRDYNFDREGDENIITVADQFDIGVSWDRIFIGVANSGRFCGSPVDTAYWISRNMFYPALVFENPAMKGKTSLIQGSTSSREGIRGLLRYPIGNSLVINEGGEEKFEYPVLCSFVTQKYRFNERASKYYGATYECADGLVPGESPSFEAIDMGSIKEHTGKDGSYFADMSETEMVPFYLERGGYDPVLSTSFDAVSENLNRGVLLWIHASHGSHGGGGNTDFWNVEEAWPAGLKILKPFIGALKEENPQAGYEWMLGSTEEPDTMTMDIKGIVPFTNWDGPIWPDNKRNVSQKRSISSR